MKYRVKSVPIKIHRKRANVSLATPGSTATKPGCLISLPHKIVRRDTFVLQEVLHLKLVQPVLITAEYLRKVSQHAKVATRAHFAKVRVRAQQENVRPVVIVLEMILISMALTVLQVFTAPKGVFL